MNSRSLTPRFLVVCILLSAVALSVLLRAAVTITRTELDPDGRLRILFTDTPASELFTLESRGGVDAGAEWSPWGPVTATCLTPPLFQMVIPSPDGPQQFYRIGTTTEADSGAPRIVAAEPAGGAVDVPAELGRIRITFDRPMAGTVAWTIDQQWGGSYATWSADKRTVEIHRFTADSPLPTFTTLRFAFNPNGTGFADEQGNPVATCTYSFTTGLAAMSGSHVVSSVPANNALAVDPLFDTIELRFSEPMMKSGGVESQNWMPWKMSWSEDGRTCSLRRDTAGTPMYGTSVYIRTPAAFFYTAAGQQLANEYVLRFTTADPPVIRVDANPARGFCWPYQLFVPPSVEPPATLLVEPNNTGNWSDDPWVHESAALGIMKARSSFALRLRSPLLVPVFPRPMTPPAPEPGGIYIHALDRYSLSSQWSGLQRIDLQMVAMIDDALERLAALGHTMDRRVFMMGFSASGAFTSRFALLHPDRVKAAAPGSPGGWPLAPVGSWEGRVLKYAVGIHDVEALTGQPFDLDAFRQVALYIYVGGADTNEALDTRGMTAEERDAICQWLSCASYPLLAQRWPIAQAIYDSVGANAQFKVYPGVTHTITTQMFDDVLAFFAQHR